MSASDEIKQALVAKFPGTEASQWKRLSKRKVSGVEARLFENTQHKLLIRSVGDDLQQVDNQTAWDAINMIAIKTGIQDWVLTEPADDDADYIMLASPSTGHRASINGVVEDYDYPPPYLTTTEPMYFVIAAFDDDFEMSEDGESISMMTCPKGYWDKNKCITDWHVSPMICHLFPNIPDEIEFDEASENMIYVSGGTLDELKAAMITAGMVYNEALLKAGQY